MAVTGLFGKVQRSTSAEAIATGNVGIRFLRWVGASAAGHSLIVDDADGNIIAESEADGANFTDIIPLYDIYNGVTIDTIDSGKLYVYYA